MNPAASAVARLPSLPVPGTWLLRYFLVLLSVSSHIMFFALLFHIPTSPLNFKGSRLKDFVYVQRKHTKVMMGREFTEDNTFPKSVFRKKNSIN